MNISCPLCVRVRALCFSLLVAASTAFAQPTVSLSQSNFTVASGGSATFHANAAGIQPITFQWRKNGNVISGATNSTLQLLNIPLADNGSIFTVAATNGGGTTVSGPGTLTVVPPLAISTQPASVAVNAGSPATFSVVVTGGAPPLTYQWRKTGISIPGATHATYTTPSTVIADSGSTFTVVVGSSVGTVISNGATLTVRVPPVITRQPANGGVNAGQTLASPFSVEATGTAPLTFQWFKNGTAIPGATNSTYLPPPAVPADNGSTFNVVVTDAAGSVESTGANLTVRFGAIIVAQPAAQSVTPGGTATFTTVATGNPAPNYQWQRLPAGSTVWIDVINGASYSGANTAALSVIGATTAMSGDQFRCIATVVHNGATLGQPATTNAAALLVKLNQTITFAPLPEVSFSTVPITLNATATSNLPVTFSVISGPAAVSGNALTLTGPGNVTVRATQTGNATFHVATPVDRTFVVTPAADPARLVNLSIRAAAGNDNQTLIVGFTIGGGTAVEPKPLLIRGAGPALAGFGVADILNDPVLTVFEGATVVATNDDWGNDVQVAARAAALGAFAFAASSRDSALVSSIAPKGYTAQLTGKSAASGVALVEVYDASTTFTGTTSRLTNVSARTQVGTGGNVLITGFVVGGSGTCRVLVRAAGPALSAFGLGGVLADPKLELFRSVGASSLLVSENDDWSTTTLAAQQSVGAFALTPGSKDAVLVAILEPGGYTAQINGVGGTTGVALVEIYQLP